MAKYALISQLTFQQTAFTAKAEGSKVKITLFGEEKTFSGTYVPMEDVEGHIRTRSDGNVPILMKESGSGKLVAAVLSGDRLVALPHVGDHTREFFKWAVEYKTEATLMISHIKQTSPMRAAYFALGSVPLPSNPAILKENTTALLDTLVPTVIPDKYKAVVSQNRNRVGFVIDMSMVKSPKIYSYNNISNLWWDLTEYAYGTKEYVAAEKPTDSHTTRTEDENGYILPHMDNRNKWVAPCNTKLVDSLLLQDNQDLTLTPLTTSISTKMVVRGTTSTYAQYTIRNSGAFARINISKEARAALKAWCGVASGINILGPRFEMFYSASDVTAVYLRKRIQATVVAGTSIDNIPVSATTPAAPGRILGEGEIQTLNANAGNLSPEYINTMATMSMGDQVMAYQAQRDAEEAARAATATVNDDPVTEPQHKGAFSDEEIISLINATDREEALKELLGNQVTENDSAEARNCNEEADMHTQRTGQWTPYTKTSTAPNSTWDQMGGDGLISRQPHGDAKAILPFGDTQPIYRAVISDIDYLSNADGTYQLSFARSQLNGYLWKDVTVAFMATHALRDLLSTVASTTLLGWQGYTVVVIGSTKQVLCVPVNVSTFFTETLIVPKLVETMSPEDQVKHLISTHGLQTVLTAVAANAHNRTPVV